MKEAAFIPMRSCLYEQDSDALKLTSFEFENGRISIFSRIWSQKKQHHMS